MQQDWLVSALKFIRLNLGILLVSVGLFVVLVWGGLSYLNSQKTSQVAQDVQGQISATATIVPTSSPEIVVDASVSAKSVVPSATAAAVQRTATQAAQPKPTTVPSVKPTPSPTPKPILTQIPVSSPTPIATTSARPTPQPTATPAATIKPIVKATATPSASVAVKTSPKPTALPTPKPISTPKPTPVPTATPQPVTAPALNKGGLPVNGSVTEAPTAPSTKGGTYTVVKGDSTWKVAQKFYANGFRYVEIEKANKLKHNQHLRIGQVLVIPHAQNTDVVKSDSTKVENGQVQHSEAQTMQATGGEYVVKAGDSLWKIATSELHDAYRWTELYTANKQTVGHNPNLIYPGQKLHLPAAKATGPNRGK